MAGDDSFLSRWARRKSEALQGKPLTEPELPKRVSAVSQKNAVLEKTVPVAEGDTKAVASSVAPPTVPEPPALTLEDAHALTEHSDFKPFMARQVQPEVRNAAMKRLFADPHYNVMDGLDTYIDDYSKPDPIPESMLRQMVSAQFLKLFDEEAIPPATPPRNSSGVLLSESVAQSPEPSEPRLLPDHANTHLRLQPDHAPAAPDTGSGPA